jgi:hypothetical protein
VGYLFRVIGPVRRILFLIAAIGLLIPIVDAGEHVTLTWASNGVGLVLGAALILIEWLARSRAASRPAVAAANVQAPAGNPRQSER